MSIENTPTAAASEVSTPELDAGKTDILTTCGLLVVVCALGLIANWVATGTSPLIALPGMVVLGLCSVVGVLLTRSMPFYLPSVAWISLVAIIVTIPGVPGAAYVVEQVSKLNFVAMASPILAYGGLALTSNEFKIARSSGWKIVIVAICVMFGTYMGSVVIADLILRLGW